MKHKTGPDQIIRLSVICMFAAIAFAAGLYLSFIKDHDTKAQTHADISTAALIRSQNSQYADDARVFARNISYESLLKAVALSPFEPILWVHLAHILSLQPQEAVHKPEQALEIAIALDPSLRNKIDVERMKKRGEKSIGR